ncbi:hypothetical protein B0G80_4380 [Paraburkholderia sp. BL6669N2]|uniref:hypothetical protein n=1 Tax=Paraburkholderia sp. BL6669N2 TaxID=1938807 RepID=UPI000E28A108|nr:hypothetical protein [Paraburkholderia sp. BL6669N2]REG61527.1 hypothetical protein B0G80_4380 [Paraburkholderia sp. BL6669N2]
MREGGIRHRVSPSARGAQGKQNPEDLPAGSADREDATDEFLCDFATGDGRQSGRVGLIATIRQ